jgi:glycosyltransferase involved in cell wall biosynthesis
VKVLFDAQALTMYPLAKEGFTGGTETYVKVVAEGLAAKGHQVHVVANDAERDEQRGPNLWYWPPSFHPTAADVVVAVHNLEHVSPDAGYQAPVLVLMGNGLGAFLGPDDAWAQYVDAFPVFTQTHADLLVKHHKNIDPAKCHVTGLGVDLTKYSACIDEKCGGCWGFPSCGKVPGRIFVANDPARGLWHVLDIFETVVAQYPEASLHVGYDVNRHIEQRRWHSNALAEVLLDCRKRLKTIPNVVDLGALTPEQVVREQMEAQVHLWPSDPPNVGSQIHGLSQVEAAAAGCALVLSDVEAFPELFGGAAEILPVPGTFVPSAERRVDPQDWADVVLELMRDPAKWAEASRKARALAEQHTWPAVVDKWDAMLADCAKKAGL